MTTFFRFQPKFPGIFKSLGVRARSGGHVTYGGPAAEKDARDNFLIKTQFIDSKEEELLMSEIKKSFRRSKYEYSHWDGVITGYRETEKSNWSDPVCRSVIERLQQVTKSYSTVGTGDTLPLVHVLDLAEDGYIKRHIDNIKFCGDIISGISLLSDSVMRLTHSDDKDKCILAFLPRYSLYVMKGVVRYNYEHEILKNEESYFDGRHIPRQRRVSVICRTQP